MASRPAAFKGAQNVASRRPRGHAQHHNRQRRRQRTSHSHSRILPPSIHKRHAIHALRKFAFLSRAPLVYIPYTPSAQNRLGRGANATMKILLPIDESKFSHYAIRAVMRQFPRAGTQVEVLHVVEPVSAYVSADLMPHFVRHLDTIEADRKRHAQRLVLRAAHKLRAAGFKTTAMVTLGQPVSEIVGRAKRWHADVIVIASYDLRGINRLLMGSIAESVMRHADCTVEVVRLPRPRAKTAAKRRTP